MFPRSFVAFIQLLLCQFITHSTRLLEGVPHLGLRPRISIHHPSPVDQRVRLYTPPSFASLQAQLLPPQRLSPSHPLGSSFLECLPLIVTAQAFVHHRYYLLPQSHPPGPTLKVVAKFPSL